MDGKKTEAFTVKARAEQAGFESPSEFIRSLLDAEHHKALSDFNLLSVALGIKGNAETIGNKGEVK